MAHEYDEEFQRMQTEAARRKCTESWQETIWNYQMSRWSELAGIVDEKLGRPTPGCTVG